ncbi:MAG: OB-fold nucleic acid binding domain-containing protein [Actinomycetota bacterium]
MAGLCDWVKNFPDATPIERVEERKHCTVAGVIQNVRIDPREGHGSIEATLIDGTGQINVKWFGRPSKEGIRIGGGLLAKGTVGKDRSGELTILNPEYDLVDGPRHS